MPFIRAQKDFRRLAFALDFMDSLRLTGRFKLPPVAELYALRPASFKPPSGFLCFFFNLKSFWVI